MEKTAALPPWKTPPAFPTFPQLQRRLRVTKLSKLVVSSCERKKGAGHSLGVPLSPQANRPAGIAGPKGATAMAWFYEIRSSINTLLKRDGGFPTQEAAK